MDNENYGWVKEDYIEKYNSEQRIEFRIYPWFVKLIKLSDKHTCLRYLVKLCMFIGIGLVIIRKL